MKSRKSLTNPFEALTTPALVKEDLEYDEWGGQFLCSTVGCRGYAKIARYFPKSNLLVWKCEYGHKSKLENAE